MQSDKDELKFVIEKITADMSQDEAHEFVKRIVDEAGDRWRQSAQKESFDSTMLGILRMQDPSRYASIMSDELLAQYKASPRASKKAAPEPEKPAVDPVHEQNDVVQPAEDPRVERDLHEQKLQAEHAKKSATPAAKHK